MHDQDEFVESTKLRDGAPQFQISLGTILLLMLVCCVMSAGLFHASRIPKINDELDMMFGHGGSGSGSGRTVQIIFIMFTYSMPLIMAGILSTMSTIWKIWNRRR